MLQTSIDRLRTLIIDLSGELAASTEEARARALRQTLALLQAAAETLDEIERTRARSSTQVATVRATR